MQFIDAAQIIKFVMVAEAIQVIEVTVVVEAIQVIKSWNVRVIMSAIEDRLQML